MIIQSGDVRMSSARQYKTDRKHSFSHTSQTVSMGTGTLTSSLTGRVSYGALDFSLGFSNFLGGGFIKKREDMAAQGTEKTGLETLQDSMGKDGRIQTISYLLRQLFYHRMGGDYGITLNTLSQNLFYGNPIRMDTYETFSSYTEEEELQVSAEGTVKTADGREISIGIDVGMSRRFYEENYDFAQNLSTVNLCDPLVINLDTEAASLSTQKFFFDLDGDGEEEYISKLGAGSAFLALDRNGDGKINDGTELFGTQSGDGFYDLAQYDEDGNGWIDEADPIFSQLKIWAFDAEGNAELYTLKEKGVGAICLQHVGTQFALKDEDNKLDGMVRSTGVFLLESGSAGTIQHVDLAM